MSAITSALSGMQASMARINASASNVANADSVGAVSAIAGARPAPADAPYQPVAVQQTAQEAGGVSVTYAPRQPAFVARFDPSSSHADASGMVAAPNVDLVDERVEQLAAQQAYQANLAVLHTANELQKKITDMLG